jgi:hypothetical protein
MKTTLKRNLLMTLILVSLSALLAGGIIAQDGKVQNIVTEVRVIDNCEYIIFEKQQYSGNSIAVVHKANCKNPKHTWDDRKGFFH